MEAKYMPSIFIALLTLGTPRVEHFENLLRWFLCGKYRLRYYPCVDVQPGYKARNVCHREFLKDSYDYLLFLDDDTIPPVDVIDRLLKANKDMISATVQTLFSDKGVPKLIPVAYRWNEDDPEDKGYKAYWGSGVEEVDVTTCACTLIKRKVLKVVGRGAFTNWHKDEWCIEGKSGDFCFSEKVRADGFRIWNDYGILCDHYKTFSAKKVNELMLLASEGK